MTIAEKTSIARFIDLSADVIRGGYRAQERIYQFADDSEPVDSTGDSPEKPELGGLADSLESVALDVSSCTACPLCKTRKKTVPGEGVTRPDVMVVGEGPGADEDAAGRPFVGSAGRLLDKMLDAIGLSRESNCYIANVIKCRPPDNRDPRPEETTACVSFLERQILLLRPKIILCAGRIAAQTLLKTAETTGSLRGTVKKIRVANEIIPLIVTYHPSALLRKEEYKRPAWEDLKTLKAWLNGGES